jgi:hypothetical protein
LRRDRVEVFISRSTLECRHGTARSEAASTRATTAQFTRPAEPPCQSPPQQSASSRDHS